MAVYNWKADLNFVSGDPGLLSHGVTPSAQENWQNADTDSSMSPGQYTYWYRDSNTMWSGAYQDTLSSRVALKVTQTWTATVDNLNNLTITVNTVVDSIDRDDVQAPTGYSDTDTPGREITLYKNNGTVIFYTTDTQVAHAHNLSGPINVGSESFTIAPGDMSAVGASLYLHNQTVGGQSYDDIWLGVQFRNPLPADYRPGSVYDNNVWQSHNRNGGTCHVLSNTTGPVFTEMRTIGAPTAMGNPPSTFHNNKWYNMARIGKE